MNNKDKKTEIALVKPRIWNFETIKKQDAWKEVVYSARVSGVPKKIIDKDVFAMIVKNDYGSALEHIIIKFDMKMTKGNAPEFLEHRMVSHTGYSTRYTKVNQGFHKDKSIYEIIVPFHLLNNDLVKDDMLRGIRHSIDTYDDLLSKKIPKEIARYVLPFAQAVGIYHVTINLRSFLNFLSLRLCVRSSPELRCIAAQLYFELIEKLPIMRDLVGCRGFTRGVCPESGVTGVRTGNPHPFYPVCPFRNKASSIYIPTKGEVKKGVKVLEFDIEKATLTQESVYRKWMAWE